ncbi:MAG: hypothetical protein LBN38_03905 [Verrucomicrobiota bacterium]|jgi:hypothetical protein|nr:hypothetical protein [Verrucomicrobiota bacterium]
MKNPFSLFVRAIALSTLLPAAALLLAACEVGSSDSTSGVASDNSGRIYDFSGLYANISSGQTYSLVYPAGKQSGEAVVWLRLMQSGSRLEGYDNASMTWKGHISDIRDGAASFQLSGKTTVGAPVEIAGKLTYHSGNSMASMDASWLEPSFSGNIMASAAVSTPATNTPPTNIPPTNNNSNIVLGSAGSGMALAWVQHTWRSI